MGMQERIILAGNGVELEQRGYITLYNGLYFLICVGSFKIQKYGNFRNPLGISKRMVYNFFDFDQV